MKIDILTVNGSPMGVTEMAIYGDGVQLGVGGAELALLTMCRAWTEYGHEVTLYNNPRGFERSGFAQANQVDFQEAADRDILILFRGPNDYATRAKGKKIWWSCDQQTHGDYRKLASEVDEIVTISPFHANYFEKRYGISNTNIIDIPVREWDYMGVEVEKNPKQVLFCSVPDRGLEQLAPIWARITARVPDAVLHITSDWRLWDAHIPVNTVAKYRLQFAGFNNVRYHSLVTRSDLVKLQLESSIHLYPCVYEELFCISSAETQYAGCYPITSNVGALATTNMGTHCDTQDEFVEETIKYLLDPDSFNGHREEVLKKAKDRFSIERAIKKWQSVLSL